MDALLISLYSLLPLVTAYSYLPQILALRSATVEQAKAMSLFSWGIWLTSSAISTSYAFFILADWRVVAINGITLICCTIICSMIAGKRYLLSRVKNTEQPIQLAPVILEDVQQTV